MDLTGHTLTVVPPPGPRSVNAAQGRLCVMSQTEYSLYPRSQEAHLQDLLKHIACQVQLHAMMMATAGPADDAERREEILYMLRRFRLDDPLEARDARVIIIESMIRVWPPQSSFAMLPHACSAILVHARVL